MGKLKRIPGDINRTLDGTKRILAFTNHCPRDIKRSPWNTNRVLPDIKRTPGG